MKNKFLILIIIVIFGFVLRIFQLSNFPPSLNWDEISHGYNAYSILKTGSDEWGKAFPIANFRAYGDYPLPLNLYLTMPFITALGLNEFSIRVPHAILGTATIISIYFLCYGLTKRKDISLLAAFLGAIDPWLLFPSRAVFQSNLSVFFLTTAMALFFNRPKNKLLLPLSFLSLGLTLFSYHSTRIFSPLLLIGIMIVYRNEIIKELKKPIYKLASRGSLVLSVFLVILFFVPLPFILLNPDARARSSVVFLVDPGAINQINSQRNSSNSPFKKIIFNKVTYFTTKFAQNYIEYFSPQFLFISGGTQYQFSVPGQGLLYLVNLPFFYLGLILCILKFKDKNYKLLLIWLILAPVPASITQEKFAVIRSTTMLPIPEILVAIGIISIIDKLKNNKEIGIIIYIILVMLCFEQYENNYFGTYTKNYSWAWQYGYKQIVDYSKENYQKYDQIIVTKKYGEPHEFFLFFNNWDPEKYKTDKNLVRFAQSNWFWVDRFDKYNFINDWDIQNYSKGVFILESKTKVDCNNKKCLLVTSPDNHPKNWHLLKNVNFLDNTKAFEIYEN